MAARAVASSPSGWKARWLPAGAITIGELSGWPSSSSEVVNAGGIDHAHRAQVPLVEGRPVGEQGFIAVGAGRQVAEVRRRQDLLRHALEVEHVQGVFGRGDRGQERIGQVGWEAVFGIGGGQQAGRAEAHEQRAGGEELDEMAAG